MWWLHGHQGVRLRLGALPNDGYRHGPDTADDDADPDFREVPHDQPAP